MHNFALGLVALGALSVVSATEARANLLVNGSFETGNFNGWTTSGDTSYAGVYTGTFGSSFFDPSVAPEQGTYAADLGTFGNNSVGLSQTITDTAGEALLITGYYAGYTNVDPNGVAETSSLKIAFDNDILVDLNPGPTDQNGWTEFTAEVIGTGSDTFSITSQQQLYYNLVDNFSITAATPTPEPGTLSLIGAGLVGLGAVRRRKKTNRNTAQTA